MEEAEELEPKPTEEVKESSIAGYAKAEPSWDEKIRNYKNLLAFELVQRKLESTSKNEEWST